MWRRLSRAIRNIGNDDRGSVAVEFGLTMIPLLALLVGAITYSGIVASVLVLNYAASEGARGSIAGVTLCERQSRAIEIARNSLLFPTIIDTAVVNAIASDDTVKLEISYDYRDAPLTPILFFVPEKLSTTMVAHTDGLEYPAGGC